LVLKNRINALNPHIGCHIDYFGTFLKIGKVSIAPAAGPGFKCGEIISVDSEVKIATGNGILIIHELQKPGGKMLRVGDFVNGFTIKSGETIPSWPMRELVSAEPYARRQK
jgi:methionyl-tRNA formyltransferase